MEKGKSPATSAAPNDLVTPAVESQSVKPCSEEPGIYVEADVPSYEEEFTLSGGCCSGS